MSTSALTCDSNLVLFFSIDGFLIQDMNTKRTIGKGDSREDLYVLQVANNSTSFMITKVGAKVWHKRLGHPSRQKLSYLKNMLDFSACNKSPCKTEASALFVT